MITAPFNFVPLSDKVFFPPWADEVSHDIPFEDGESGEIDITITAKSPICIKDHEDPEQFCQHNGQYFIPGSSVKGMVRNVLEIMSFGKLAKETFNDNTFAVRDLSSAQNFYMKQMNLLDAPFTQCGWLKKEGDTYIIEDCGIPGRIHHNQIDQALGIDFASHFHEEGFEKTARFKYDLLGGTIRTIRVGDAYMSENNPKYDKRQFHKFDSKGKPASLILTGQPTPRKNSGKMGDGKGFEFLFFNAKGKLEVTKKVFENFIFAYFDSRETEPKESPDWTYWKKKLYAGDKIPVFFQKEGKNVLHFGLSYLYKLPYKHSIGDGIEPIHFDDRADLAQTIFGYVNGAIALKGRVSFSHFKAINEAKPLQPRKEILGTPRASYYPVYVRQHGTDFKTYMDGDFSIAGRKRYPIHRGNRTSKTEDTENENVGTTFTPLQDGVVFQGKLRYHNLKKCEKGALISALTFHNTPSTYHNIGSAKPLGYGKVEIQLHNVDDTNVYLQAFETCMTAVVSDWKDSVQLKELLCMAIEQNNSGESQLGYMKLKDFADSKSKDKSYLKCYSEFKGIQTVSIQTLVDEEALKEYKLRQKKFEEKRKARQKEKDDWQRAKMSNTIQALEHFISSHENSGYLDKATEMIKDIKENEAITKKAEAQKEANEKWAKIQHVEPKFKKQALEDFIAKYPESDHVVQAKSELSKFSATSKVTDQTAGLTGLADETDIKLGMSRIKQYRSSNNGVLTAEDKGQIEAFFCAQAKAKGCGKKLKKGTKELEKWLDAGRYEAILAECCTS